MICRLATEQGVGHIYASVREHNQWTRFNPRRHHNRRNNVVPFYEVWVRVVDRTGVPQILGAEYQREGDKYHRHHCYYFKVVCCLVDNALVVRTCFATRIPPPISCPPRTVTSIAQARHIVYTNPPTGRQTNPGDQIESIAQNLQPLPWMTRDCTCTMLDFQVYQRG